MRPLVSVGLAMWCGVLFLGCGDTELECGPGTAEQGGQCIVSNDDPTVPPDEPPDPPVDSTVPTTSISPAPGTYRSVDNLTLTADEPAIIFFTTDGSEPDVATSFGGFSPLTLPPLEEGTEVRFFAVDEAGNVEETQTALYEIDRVSPGPACGFSASADGLDASVSWTNPADDDFGGVVVVRYDAVATAGRPVDGEFYGAGDTLPGGGEVILSGLESSLSDALPAATGAYVYAVWAHDAVGNYSIVSSNKPLATRLTEQTATVTVDLETNEVTVDKQPADLTLSATASYDGPDQTLTLNVSANNKTARQLFNLRLATTDVVVDGVPGGTPPASSPFGAPISLEEPGSAVLVINGVVDGAGTATVKLEFEDSPYMLARGDAVSASGLEPGFDLGIQFSGNSRGVVINPTATQALFDQKRGATVVFDMLSLSEIGPLILDEGSVHAAAYTSAGIPFAASQGATHWYGTRGGEGARLFPNPVRLHQLDPITLEPVRSLDVLRADGLTARSLLLLPDCRSAALLLGSGAPEVGNKLAIIDINVMAVDRIIDLPQPAAGVALAERAVASPDGNTIYIGLNSRARVLRNASDDGGDGGSNLPVPLLAVDLATDEVRQISFENGGQMATGILAIEDRVYYSSRTKDGTPTPLVVIDIANDDAISTVVGTDVFPSEGGGNIVLAPTGDALVVWRGGLTSEAVVVDLATNTVVEGAQAPVIDVDPHGVAIAPF